MNKPLPTKEQFMAYERVRQDGRFNMFFPAAQLKTGLSKEVYLAVLENYGKLAEKYPLEDKDNELLH